MTPIAVRMTVVGTRNPVIRIRANTGVPIIAWNNNATTTPTTATGDAHADPTTIPSCVVPHSRAARPRYRRITASRFEAGGVEPNCRTVAATRKTTPPSIHVNDGIGSTLESFPSPPRTKPPTIPMTAEASANPTGMAKLAVLICCDQDVYCVTCQLSDGTSASRSSRDAHRTASARSPKYSLPPARSRAFCASPFDASGWDCSCQASSVAGAPVLASASIERMTKSERIACACAAKASATSSCSPRSRLVHASMTGPSRCQARLLRSQASQPAVRSSVSAWAVLLLGAKRMTSCARGGVFIVVSRPESVATSPCFSFGAIEFSAGSASVFERLADGCLAGGNFHPGVAVELFVASFAFVAILGCSICCGCATSESNSLGACIADRADGEEAAVHVGFVVGGCGRLVCVARHRFPRCRLGWVPLRLSAAELAALDCDRSPHAGAGQLPASGQRRTPRDRSSREMTMRSGQDSPERTYLSVLWSIPAAPAVARTLASPIAFRTLRTNWRAVSWMGSSSLVFGHVSTEPALGFGRGGLAMSRAYRPARSPYLSNGGSFGPGQMLRPYAF